MWTPRRMMLVFAGLLLFSGGFTVYSRLFGWIDGLPPLPDSFLQKADGNTPLPDPDPSVVPPLQARLRQAFGVNCIEQTYNLKFEARERGLLFAAAEAQFLDDGRVQFQQLSVAVFGKTTREMTTIHADRAILTFEQPVRKIEDMNNRKVVGAELQGDPEFKTSDPRKGRIHLISNRRTIETEDDLVLITPGPIFYVDEPKPTQPHIWTTGVVELTDRQNRPLATQPESQLELPTVTAEGMRVFLAPEPPGAAKKPERKTIGASGGVERIELERRVFMNLWTESRNMFGGDASKKPAVKKDGPAEKVLITIQTNGPFAYNMPKDHAHFEVPPPSDPNIQEYVKVTRHSKGNNEDTLTSDFLDVQFKRKRKNEATAPKKDPPKDGAEEKTNSPDRDMEIETIHAWGKNIALSSDDDALFAYGFDLQYDATQKQTVLKGAPMHAVKDGNLIRSPELLLANLDDSEKRHARARGPGIIGMGDMDPKTQEHSRQAHWQEWLVVERVREHGRDLDLITLTGGARFMDTINEQRLTGRQLKLWLLGNDKKSPAPVPKKDPLPKGVARKGPDEKALPHRLEATGDVTVSSRELVVNKSEYLNLWFKDIAADTRVEPGAAPPMNPKLDPKLPMPPVVAKNDQPDKKNPPIVFRQARRIEAWINRTAGKNDLDKMRTEGNVVIHQDPTPDSEKGVDIAGHSVDLEHFADGNYLIVTGNDQHTGEVHFDKISIIADDIKIDQRDNTANVKGPGYMGLLSKTSLDGKELSKPTDIDIYWNEAMELDGPIQLVRYEGAVQAKQEGSKVLCETMQVWLDRPLYLNQMARAKDRETSPKKNEPKSSPKVEKVICDQVPSDGDKKMKPLKPVLVEDIEKVGGKMVKFVGVEGLQVGMENEKGTMTAYGPGTMRIWQLGDKDPAAMNGQPMAKAKGKADEEMKLTWVSFDRRMVAVNHMPKKATFFNAVEMVHMPSDKHDAVINIAKLPERALHLKCQKYLEVTTQSRKVRDASGKEVEVKWQEMKAEGNVRVRSDDFDGWAGLVTYSEEKSLLIFNSTTNPDGTVNPAVLSKSDGKGTERKTFRGKKITYNTKSKDFSVDDSIGGSSN